MHNVTRASNRSHARILIVDDDDTARRSLAEILRLEGYQVIQAANVTQAIELLENELFDAVLLDLRMPIENSSPTSGITEKQAGLVVLNFVVEKSPEIPVIFLTAHGSLETAIEALRHDAEDYLLKPAAPEQILAALDKAVARHQAELQRREQTTALNQARAIAEHISQSLDQLGLTLQALKENANESGEQNYHLQGSISAVATEPARKDSEKTMSMRKPVLLLARQGVTIDLQRREIRQETESQAGMEATIRRISLTPTEGRLIQVFIEHPGKVFSHRELVTLVQGYDSSDFEAPMILRPLISRLRNKLKAIRGDDWIRSLRGTGYVFEIPSEPLKQET